MYTQIVRMTRNFIAVISKIRNFLPHQSKLILIYLIFLPLPLANSRLDPDMHHDGLMYAAALAVSKGLVPNRDIFGQYGFGTPYIQGIWLNLTSDSLLSLRVFTALQLATVALLLYIISRKFLSPTTSFLVAITWLAQLSARIPWSSILVTLSVLLAILIVLEGSNNLVTLTTKHKRLFASGVMISIACTFRIQIITFILFTSLFLLFYKSRRKQLFYLLLGFATFSSFFIIVLLQISALDSLIQQAITWPQSAYKGPRPTKSFFVGLSLYPITYFVINYGYECIVFSNRKINFKLQKIVALLSVLSAIIIGWNILDIPNSDSLSLNHPKAILYVMTDHLVNFLGFWSATALVVFLSITLFKMGSGALFDADHKVARIFLLFAGLSVLPQLYPLHDQVHLWYVTPVLLVGCLSFVAKEIQSGKSARLWVNSILLISLSLSLISAIQDFQKPRVMFKNFSMSGLFSPQSDVSKIDNEMIYLQKYSNSHRIAFDCEDGMYAGAGRNFLSDDPMYVNWGPKRSNSITDSITIFGCKKTREELQGYLVSGYTTEKVWSSPNDRIDFIVNRVP